ncbi:MAG: HD domain-containing protein [Anaerolineaceae bacterium]|nr:HD domain-containing protein [Anaerolineaceae bacterium]
MKNFYDEIVRLTETNGGSWGINHTKRLMKLIAIIADDQVYNEEVLWMAAHTHDWGAYAGWRQDGVDHVERSLQVVGSFLEEREYQQELIVEVLDCIANHHSERNDLSLEATLLRDADAVDFLGVVGVMRNFSRNPKDMRKGFQMGLEKRQKLPSVLVLPKAKEMAEKRIVEMDSLLSLFESDSWGYY